MGRGQITIAVIVVSAVLLSACSGAYSEDRDAANDSDSEVTSSSSPPFSTREPDRYQAVRTITLSGPLDSPQTTLIFRDGLRRREEYDFWGKRIIYLEMPEGRYILSPSEQIFAKLNPTTGDPRATPSADTALSPNSLSFTQVGEPRYRIVGREVIDGRETVKYRITDAGILSETFVWFDENLGMPIRTEMRRTATDTPEVVMELKKISLEVDAKVFDLPQNYRQVDSPVILGTKER